MTRIRHEKISDIPGRDALLDAAFGERRFAKASERLREDRLPADGLSFVATEKSRGGERIVGTVRLWNVSAGPGRPALLLGPMAVAADRRGRGLGATLMTRALDAAKARGHRAVLLVGDAPYYSRFGFSADATGALWMPGPYERDRLLALELTPGALAGARGLIGATGRPEPLPDFAALVAAASRDADMHRAA